jgi:Helix-turn-helix domain
MLQIYRKRAGLSQKALAEKAGLSPSQVSRIEGGEVDPQSKPKRAGVVPRRAAGAAGGGARLPNSGP